ncbi:MAG: HRDC domain-containing protein, partial [Gemmataceae bacterium]|nr:HRDC domain-containing protein [Gemmataceae bacterium]
VLLYSGGDVVTRKEMKRKSAEEALDKSFLPGVLKHLDEIDRFARGAVCRHKQLVEYFGQPFGKASCGACDLCLGDFEEVPDQGEVAKKLLSCVARVKENFGVGHVLNVVRGKATDSVRKWGHEKLTTYGILKEQPEADLRDWLYQLIGQGVLVQTEDEYPKLRLNDGSWQVMKGEREVRLVRLVRRKKGEKPRKAAGEAVSWEGVDTGLFEVLRSWRRALAQERQVPPFVIFPDTTLRELAKKKPSTLEALRGISGIGDAKLRDYGEALLTVIEGAS